MLTWIKRAVRWPWFGATAAPLPVPPEYAAHMAAVRDFYGKPNNLIRVTDDGYKLQKAITIAQAATEATIAQKNVRLASIARTRGKLKDEIARLKRNRKRHSHLQAELARLTRLELELESGK